MSVLVLGGGSWECDKYHKEWKGQYNNRKSRYCRRSTPPRHCRLQMGNVIEARGVGRIILQSVNSIVYFTRKLPSELAVGLSHSGIHVPATSHGPFAVPEDGRRISFASLPSAPDWPRCSLEEMSFWPLLLGHGPPTLYTEPHTAIDQKREFSAQRFFQQLCSKRHAGFE